MKKTFKILRNVLLVILVLLICSVAAVVIFADRALKIGIETAVTKTLSVKTTLGSVHLSILGGWIRLDDLEISNPPGYQYDKLIGLKKVEVQVDINSLLSDTVNIKQIQLDGIDLTIEQKSITGNNLNDVINSLKPAEQKESPQTSEKPGKKLHIDCLDITNVSVKAKLLPIPGKSDTVTLKLAPIKMTDLGGDNKLDIAALSSKILAAIAKGVTEQGAGLLPEDMTSTIKSGLDKTMSVGGDVVGTSKKLGGDTVEKSKEVGGAIINKGKDLGQGITKGLSGLLGSKKDPNSN